MSIEPKGYQEEVTPTSTVYSVPGTGTRFIMTFFSSQDIHIRVRHVNERMLLDEQRRIFPVRHPHDCWLTWNRTRYGIPQHERDIEFLGLWANFLWKTEQLNGFYFPIDIAAGDRISMLTEAVRYMGFEPNLPKMQVFAFAWQPVGSSKGPETPPDKEIPGPIYAALQGAVEWYEYYTEVWGERTDRCASFGSGDF